MGSAEWAQPMLTQEQSDRLFMLLLDDDVPPTSQLAMADLKFWAVSSFVHSLRDYAHEHNCGWYVTALLSLSFTLPTSSREFQIRPDALVAFAPERTR